MPIKTLALIVLASAVYTHAAENKPPATHAEALGFPAGKRVVIFHADDIGMCEEANIAAEQLLGDKLIQSAAIMVPCPAANKFIRWAIDHPQEDVGLHLTLTSEWENYRWGPITPSNEVPGLVDSEGKFWSNVPDVVKHATPKEVETEIRAQINYSIAMGYRPDHIDTHMGTLFGHPEYVEVFFRVAQEYGIPASVVDLRNPKLVNRLRQLGFPIDDRITELAEQYKLPKLDDFGYVPGASSYQEKVARFKSYIEALSPGLTEILFHPSVESDLLISLTPAWEQRVWETQLFADPEVIQFLKDEDIIVTNWKEIMDRFNASKE